MKRRELLKSAGAGLLILPSGMLSGQNAPSNKLNIALIGVWGRGTAHYNVLAQENVVALCDVNEIRLAEALQVFPGARTYVDWRKCLDQKGIDAVVICTADHHHAFICNWAMNRGMHVFCEKPLGITVEEARSVRSTFLKYKGKLATQHGTQRHAFPNFERLRELILDGAVGELRTVSAWDSRQLPRPGYPPEQGSPPDFFNWVQWVGPSLMRPYSPQYFAAPSAGMNCLSWNMYREFGVGQIGDMGAHIMDLAWNAIDAGAPLSAEADMEVSDPYNPDVTPVRLKVTFEHPKNSWRGPISVEWYQGGLKPPAPRNFIDLSRIGNGVIFEGSKGFILADFNTRLIIPNNDDGDMTYYRRRTPEQLLPLVGGTGQPSPQSAGRPVQAPAAARGGGAPAAPLQQQPARGGGVGPDGFPIVQLGPNGIPPALGTGKPLATPTGFPLRPPGRESVFQQEWLDACKGKNNRWTHCDFDYSGTMIEQMLLGLVTHAVGRKIEYDPVSGRVTNVAEANRHLRKEYSPGWNLNG